MGTPGQCRASTRRQNGSISINPTVRMRLVHAAASEKPPIPEKVSNIRHITPPINRADIAIRSQH